MVARGALERTLLGAKVERLKRVGTLRIREALILVVASLTLAKALSATRIALNIVVVLLAGTLA